MYPSRYGVAEADLRAMSPADGMMKRELETAAECLSTLTHARTYGAMADLAAAVAPPSRAHALALEAAIILLNPRKRFRPPSANVAAVSWQASRYLLANATEFVERLREALSRHVVVTINDEQ